MSRHCTRSTIAILIAALIAGCGGSIPATPTPAPPVRVVTTASASPFVRGATDRTVTGTTPFVITLAASNPDLMAAVTREPVIGITLYFPPESALWATPLGEESIAVVVNPAGTIHELTLSQVQDIYAGRAPEWAAAVREEGDDSRLAFEAMALRGVKPAATTIVAPSPEAMLNFVASTPNGIGYLPLRWVTDDVKAVAVDSRLPTDPEYRLKALIVAVAQQEPSAAAREWLAKVQSGGEK